MLIQKITITEKKEMIEVVFPQFTRRDSRVFGIYSENEYYQVDRYGINKWHIPSSVVLGYESTTETDFLQQYIKSALHIELPGPPSISYEEAVAFGDPTIQ